MSQVKDQIEALNALSIDELQQELLVLRKQQFVLRLKRKTEGVLEKPHQITEARKKIARIKTLMTKKAGESNDSK